MSVCGPIPNNSSTAGSAQSSQLDSEGGKNAHQLARTQGFKMYLTRTDESRQKTYWLTKTEIESKKTVAKKRLTVSNLANHRYVILLAGHI